MSYSKFMMGAPLLTGSNTVPGQVLTKEEKEHFTRTMQLCRDYGCDFYDTVVQKLTYDEMSEVAAYGGFPRRFPHWKWGMEYEELQRGYEYGQHRIYEMVINCCELATPVLTNRGTVAAKDVKVGDQVIVNNETRKVVAVQLQESSKTLKVKLRNGQTVICTPNHKWRVLTTQGLDWKETKLLKSDDLLVGVDNCFQGKPAPFQWSMDDVINETKPNVRWALKDIVPPKKMTLILAQLLGVLTGDGSVGVQGAENQIVVSIGKEFPYYVRHVSELISVAFGVKERVTLSEKPGCMTVILSSKPVIDFLDSIGFKKGCTYKNKRIPSSIWASSNEFRAAYLRGLFDTDGYASGIVGMSCYNKDLADDVQIMLTEMGIQTCLEVVPNGTGKNRDEHFIYTVELRGNPALKKFQQRIGFTHDYKAKSLDQLVNKQYCRGGGVFVPYIQNQLINWAKNQGITTYNCPSLGRSIKFFEKEQVGINCLYSFIQRAELDYGRVIPSELRILAENPIFAVETIEEGEEVETVDIALDHDAHDFVAKGLLTHNTNPCYIYILNSNTLCDNICVVAHATFHNDFFKNNIRFTPTSQNMMNKLANHGSRILKYMDRWGIEKVTEFIDHVMRIQTLIDVAKAWDTREIKDHIIRDSRSYEHPRRLNVDKDRMHMDPWVNTQGWKEHEYERIKRLEAEKELGLFSEPDKDIFGFIKDHAPMKPWQADILSMLYEEAMYFAPQRATKTLNEGWASYGDYEIMTRQGYVGMGQKTHDAGIIEYAIHKMGVLGGKYSMNPYKTGFYLLLDIEERWDKGQFGREWEECKNMHEKENWDKKLMLGKEKVFEVRKYYDDVTFLQEFFTQEFCDKFEFFEWKHYPNGEYRIETRDAKKIKKKLLQRHLNGGLPDIRLTDPNHRNKGWLFLQHQWDGRLLYEPYVRETLTSLHYLWGHEIILATRDKDEQEVVFICAGTNSDKDIALVTRHEYENKW